MRHFDWFDRCSGFRFRGYEAEVTLYNEFTLRMDRIAGILNASGLSRLDVRAVLSVVAPRMRETLARNVGEVRRPRTGELFGVDWGSEQFAVDWGSERDSYVQFDMVAPQVTKEAEKKSLQTFLDACSPSQRTQCEHSGGIDVEVKLHPDERRNGRYRLTTHRAYSVVNIRTGGKFCAQILNVPIFDQMLGLKLMLENDPVKFFEVANSSDTTLRPRPFPINYI